MKTVQALVIFACISACVRPVFAAAPSQSFITSTYTILRTVEGLLKNNPDPEESWATLTRNLKVGKIYLEAMRNRTLVSDEAGLEKLKKFFQDKGVRVCGGLAFSVSESNGYQGFDYADPGDREFAKRAVELAARHFDEILLDDYFFFDRKTDLDIKAKGTRSWTQYRIDTMRDVAENLIVKPAKAVNPKCRIIIKMANWYDQYAGMGNDTEKVPLIADGMFAGTESRLWIGQEQHLQPYQSYDIMRFMDNLKTGINQGGWVDQGGSDPIDRYSEELVDTVFARCPEICCFNYSGMISRPRVATIRPWSDQSTSLNLSEVRKSIGTDDSLTFADIAAYTLAGANAVLAHAGKPAGIKCYTPYHSTGESFLHDYLGMIGLPMDIYPYFPADGNLVLLTEQAKADPAIIQKIQAHLQAGKSICVTSGFVEAMQGKGIEEICEIEATGKSVPVRHFSFARGPGAPSRGRGFGTSRPTQAITTQSAASDPFEASRDIQIPEINYSNILTHDAWGDILGVSAGGTTYPILLSCDYSKGKLFVLTIPNDPADLYALPPAVLNIIRSTLSKSEPIRIENAPAQVSLFRYDNNIFIVQNFLSTRADVSVGVEGKISQLQDLQTQADLSPEPLIDPRVGGGLPATQATPPQTTFNLSVPPHSYAAYSIKSSN